MGSSTQNSANSPTRRHPKPSPRDILLALQSAAALPPDAPPPTASPLTDPAYLQPFSDLLAEEAHAFDRQTRHRAAALNLEIEEQYDDLSARYENIDANARQYLATHALFRHPVVALFTAETQRAFRRTLQVHSAILAAAHKSPRQRRIS